jgi:hypothetical protein
MIIMIIEGTPEECLAYVEWKESRLDAIRSANLPAKPHEPVIVPVEPPKAREEPIRTVPKLPYKGPLTKEQKTAIKEMHARGASFEEIKEKLGIYDGRKVFGVIRAEELHKKPSIETEISKLHDIGCTRGEIKERTGEKNTKLIRKVIGEKVRKEIAEEQHQDNNIKLPLTTIRRILAMDGEKMVPADISDVLEEEFGLVVSVSEIMDVIVKHAKGMVQ